MKKELKENIFNYAILVVTLVASLTMMEMVLRLYFFGSFANMPNSRSSGLREPHESRGWALKPNKQAFLQTLDYSTLIQINSKGLRGAESDYEKPSSVRRILVLGDSFMESYQVDFENSFCFLLQKKLKPENVEVINFGVGGYGTTQEYLYLLEEGFKYDPDLVLLAFLPANDLRNNSAKLEKALWRKDHLKTFGRPYARLENDSLIISKPDYNKVQEWVIEERKKIDSRIREKNFFQRTLSYKLINNILDAAGAKSVRFPQYNPNILYGAILDTFDPALAKKSFSEAEYVEHWESTWQVSLELVKAMKQKCVENGSNFAAFTIPSKIQSDPEYFNLVTAKYPQLNFNLTKPNDRLVEFCLENDIPIIDLLPYFQEAYKNQEGPLFHQYQDRHWNEQGHDLASDLVMKIFK